ncbi:MAG: bifunctional [glutamate--ammonia ligase]-adenylyl-L-tyrosine phosphorylase/[glutamate--ammonia-ligase] adenylyltransferase [Denitrovibrio sp.]|nr:MAG: bifunctional [glutamate--ammonia ligase]-adenylyl-L-tyrosine phosphorylase/[glutamate--ammonia-ligase] adenylyltransferase [Denitrovibrio sp.]
MISRFEIISKAAQEQNIKKINSDALLCIARHSEFLGMWLTNNTDKLHDICSRFNHKRDKDIILKDILESDIYSMTEEEFMTYLRMVKMREYVHIAASDIAFENSVEDVTAHISSFASAACQAAYLYCESELQKEHGIPRDEEGAEVGFCIIGLGKLGGWELNFSSDIDIMYVYGNDHGTTDGDDPVDNHVFFSKLSEKLTSLIGERTKDGIVFRVDLRLRPDGDRGAICLPVNSYELYYESHGQSWERMMLLKARTIAGCSEVGRVFQERMKPFVFRRSLDYRFMTELKDVKKKINKRVELKGKAIKHVKLGYGGIREIEFVVQTLQILHYPKYPQIVSRNTLKAIKLLFENGIMDEQTAEMLSENYRFLRKLEHMVQLENERQTHVVPEDTPTFDLYLERCGFKNVTEFEFRYSEVTRQVNHEFSNLFSDDLSVDDNIMAIFDNEFTDEESVIVLKEMGILDPVVCMKHIRRIMAGPKSKPRLQGEISVLKVLIPAILNELKEREDACQIIVTFEKLLGRNTTLYMLHDLYISAPKIISMLTNTFSYSSYLTNMILSNIDLLDYVYDPKDSDYTAKEVAEDMWERTEKYRGDAELEPEAARIRHRAYIFNAGYAYLNKTINVIDMMKSLTELARGTVDYSFRTVYEKLVEKYGKPRNEDGSECRYLLIGMGKVGSVEMSFGSDLDLIFLFEGHGSTDGKNSITNGEFFSRLVQRGNSFLNTFTRNGYLYKTDMRLRPSGSSGTLVVTMKAFESYHNKSAMIWEKQALLRSGIINEDSPLAEDFQRIKDNATFVCRLDDMGVQEVYDMRMRIEKEKG